MGEGIRYEARMCSHPGLGPLLCPRPDLLRRASPFNSATAGPTDRDARQGREVRLKVLIRVSPWVPSAQHKPGVGKAGFAEWVGLLVF